MGGCDALGTAVLLVLRARTSRGGSKSLCTSGGVIMRVLKACRSLLCGRAAPDSVAKAVGKPCKTVRWASTTPALTTASDRQREGATAPTECAVKAEVEKGMKWQAENRQSELSV